MTRKTAQKPYTPTILNGAVLSVLEYYRFSKAIPAQDGHYGQAGPHEQITVSVSTADRDAAVIRFFGDDRMIYGVVSAKNAPMALSDLLSLEAAHRTETDMFLIMVGSFRKRLQPLTSRSA